jgi:hypothetical protein
MTVETGSDQPATWWRAGRFDPLAHLEELALAIRASAVNVEDVEQRDGAANDWTVVLRTEVLAAPTWRASRGPLL